MKKSYALIGVLLAVLLILIILVASSKSEAFRRMHPPQATVSYGSSQVISSPAPPASPAPLPINLSSQEKLQLVWQQYGQMFPLYEVFYAYANPLSPIPINRVIQTAIYNLANTAPYQYNLAQPALTNFFNSYKQFLVNVKNNTNHQNRAEYIQQNSPPLAAGLQFSGSDPNMMSALVTEFVGQTYDNIAALVSDTSRILEIGYAASAIAHYTV